MEDSGVFSIRAKCDLWEDGWQTPASGGALELLELEGEHVACGQKQVRMSWRIKTQRKKNTVPMPDGNLGGIMKSAAWKCGQMVRTVALPSD